MRGHYVIPGRGLGVSRPTATEFNVNDMVRRFFNRCAAAKNSGGISLVDLAFGTLVPPDYWFDDVTLHWIPPKVRLL